MATHSSIIAWRIAMDKEVWQAMVHRVTKSWTQLKHLSIHTQHTGILKAMLFLLDERDLIRVLC